MSNESHDNRIANLSLVTLYPSNETIQAANSEGLALSHIGSTVLKTPLNSLKLNLALYVSKLTQNLLLVYRIYLDKKC